MRPIQRWPRIWDMARPLRAATYRIGDDNLAARRVRHAKPTQSSQSVGRGGLRSVVDIEIPSYLVVDIETSLRREVIRANAFHFRLPLRGNNGGTIEGIGNKKLLFPTQLQEGGPF